MRIIICGAGRVGTGIATQLASEKNDITVIDQEPRALEKIAGSLDVRTHTGFACHPTTLEEAGAGNADMLIAVTTSDEVNMIACQVAQTIFNIPVKIARIRHQNYLQPIYRDFYNYDGIPIDVIISPEIEVSKDILNRLSTPGATETIPVEESTVKIIAVKLMEGCQLDGMTIRDFKTSHGNINATIIAVTRLNELFIPNAKTRLQEGDEVYFVADTKAVVRMMVLLGHQEREAQKVVIIGGGNIGLYIAQELEKENKDTRIKIIEVNKNRAENISETLDKTIVINGSALDREILEEANMANTDAIICVSNDDEVNILSALLSKAMGTKIAFTLVNDHSFIPLMGTIGVDVAVNPRETTVSSILRHIRRGKIRSAHSLKEGHAEVLEAEVTESLGLVGKQIDDLEISESVIIGAVIRDGQFIKPYSDTVLNKRDRLIILAMADKVKSVEDIFSLHTKYF